MEQKKSWIPTWLLVIGFLGSLYGLVHAVPDSSSSLGTRANPVTDNELDDETPMVMTAQMYVRRKRHLPELPQNAKRSLSKRSDDRLKELEKARKRGFPLPANPTTKTLKLANQVYEKNVPGAQGSNHGASGSSSGLWSGSSGSAKSTMGRNDWISEKAKNNKPLDLSTKEKPLNLSKKYK